MKSRSSKRPVLPRTTLALLAATVLLSVGPVAFTQAQNRQAVSGGQVQQQSKVHAQPNVTPAEAAQRAGEEYGGKVLNVVLEHGPGGPYYQVKLLDGGSVRVVHIEARR